MKDTFIKVYTELTLEKKEWIYKQKCKAEELENMFEYCDNREMSLARTHLEQAMMWATKAVVLSE